nr:membrane dipeptidase [Bacteroidota bacterium]
MKLNLLGLLIVTWALIGCNRLSEEERIHKKAMAIHEKIFTIDSHTDTPMWFTRNEYDPGTKHDPHEHGSKVDFPRMREGNLDAIFFAVFLGQRERNKEANLEAFDRAERIFDSIYATVARNAGMAEIALTPAEAYNIEKSGRRVIFIGIENGYPIGNDLSLIGHFYDRGARYITLCHTQNN